MQTPIYSAEDEQSLMASLWAPALKDDPLKFVLHHFPWGQKNTPLENFTGPRKWQREVLRELGDHKDAIRDCSSSALYTGTCIYLFRCQVDDAPLGFFQRGRDADLLLDRHLDGLLGDPAVAVAQDVQRGVGVAFGRRGVQDGRHLQLAVSAALLFRERCDGVELGQLAVFLRQHPCGQCQAVALEAHPGSLVDRLQTRLCGLQLARLIG